MTHTYNSNAPIYHTSSPIHVHFKNIPINYLQSFKERLDPDDYICTNLSLDSFSIIVYCNFVAIDSDQMFIDFADDNSILLSFDESFTPQEVEVIYAKFKKATEE